MSNQPSFTIAEYAAKNASGKPTLEIVERWEKRVVAQGLHLRGRAGAEAYIGQFLKGAKAPKVVAFARIAEIKGCPEMAARFWEEAYFLETGIRSSFDGGVGSGESPGVVISAPILRETFGQSPQLLTLVPKLEALGFAENDQFGIQEKIDGRRALIRVKGGKVSRGNKKGLIAPVALPVADALAGLKDAVFDGEDVNGVFHAFDLLSLGEKNLTALPFAERYAILQKAIGVLPKTEYVQVVPLITGTKAKLAFIEALEAQGAEGFVMKRLDAPYEEGDGHQTQWKHQFRAQSCFIVGQKNGAKDSVQIFARNPDGSNQDLGNVTVRTTIPKPGTIIEVEYLYRHAGANGKLHQPVYKGPRDDVEADDCRIEKIKVKGTAEAGDDE